MPLQDNQALDQLLLKPSQQELLHQSVGNLLQEVESDLPLSSTLHPLPESSMINEWLQPPPESNKTTTGADITSLLETIRSAVNTGINSSAGTHLSYIPNGGLPTGAMGRYLAAGLNQYTGMAQSSPGAVALEQSLINWMTDLFGLGTESGGVLLSGGSISNFNATIAARAKMGDRFDNAVVYVSSATHHSMAKACALSGLPRKNVRVIAVDSNFRMDTAALAKTINADKKAGLRPMMIVATAGTTDTGSIDPLEPCASLAKQHQCWFHVDAAYGGFFILTERGREMLAGIEYADSISVDAHKSLFLPFGVGALLVARQQDLLEGNAGNGHYLQNNGDMPELPDFRQLGQELTRPNRGLDMWLPLHLHGVDTFRRELNRMLDLARTVAIQLRGIEGITLVGDPTLSIVCFRANAGDKKTQCILSHVNASGKVHLSSSIVDERLTVRIAFLNFRTTKQIANEVAALVSEAMLPSDT